MTDRQVCSLLCRNSLLCHSLYANFSGLTSVYEIFVTVGHVNLSKPDKRDKNGLEHCREQKTIRSNRMLNLAARHWHGQTFINKYGSAPRSVYKTILPGVLLCRAKSIKRDRTIRSAERGHFNRLSAAVHARCCCCCCG